MRNLKRVLSLALASAMLLGMMVMGAGAADKKAADLTDMDKVNNKNAVSLMVDLGIITGKPDGSYAPAETVDRATMATLIYRVLEASSDASMFVGSNSMADVKGTWAEGYINYCSSLNIVNGDGTKFYPENKVTVVQAAKMLLVALGYDATLSKYQNDSNWSPNIMRDAKAAGLLDNVDQKTNDELTRDNAALMIFNTMAAQTVYADTDRDQGVEYLKKYIAYDTTLGYETYGLVKTTAKVAAISDGKATLTDVKPGFITAGNVSNKISAPATTVGQTVTFYVKASGVKFDKGVPGDTDGSFKSIFTSELVAGDAALLGSKVGVTLAKMTTKSDKTNYVAALETDIADVSFYVNGDVIAQAATGDTVTGGSGTYYYNTSTKLVTKATGANAAAGDTDVIAAGVIVEFFDGDSNGMADVVKLTNKEVKKVTGAVKTTTDDDGNVTVYVPGVCGTAATSGYVSAKGYEGLAKDDIVLIYENAGVTYIEKAETITGKVAGRNASNKIKVDGTYYGLSALKGTGTDINIGAGKSDWADFDNEYTFYLDNGNNIVRAVKNTNATSNAYALVLESKFITGGTIGASNYMQAKVLLSDGTVEVVTVSTIDGDTVIASGKTPGADEVAYISDTAYLPGTATTGGFFTYTVDKDGKYELATGVTTDLLSNASTTSTAIKNNAKFLDGGTTYLADSKTVFVVEKGTGSNKTYTSYTGYANVPTMTASSNVVLYDKDTTVAKYVFLTTTAFSGDVAKGYVFVVDPSSNEYDPAAKTYSFKTIGVDGTESTLVVKNTSIVTTALGGSAKINQGLLEITAQDSDGVVTAVSKKTPDTLTTLSGGVLKAGSVYDYNDDTAFYVIDVAKDNKVVASEGNSIDLSDDGYTYTAAVVDKDGTATIVYVIRTVK